MLASNWSPGDLAHALRFAILGNPNAARAELDERSEDGPWFAALNGVKVHDRRNEIRGSKDQRGRPRSPRPWSAIFGTCIHQSASGALDADHPRLLAIPAAGIIHTDASLTLLHPMVLRMPHGHALNGFTIGWEIDCRDDGIEGDPRTFWRSEREIHGWWEKRKGKPDLWHRPKTRDELRRPATDGQLATLSKVLDYSHGAFFHLAPIKNRPHWGTYLHRQGHKSRTTDPGSRIARRCDAHRRARAWKDVSRETYGSGTPWPQEWRAT